MKTVQMEIATLDACVDDAQAEQVMIMRDGKPVALVIGVGGAGHGTGDAGRK